MEHRSGGASEERGRGGQAIVADVQAAQAEGSEHVAELGKRRVSQHLFDVALGDGAERGVERSAGTNPGDDVESQRGNREQRLKAAEHKDTGGHHRGGVDQG